MGVGGDRAHVRSCSAQIRKADDPKGRPRGPDQRDGGRGPGAVADGSGWEAVANILIKDGYKVSVVQHPETSYADDQKYTKAAIDAMDGPVVLVGHSYGGSVITEAGNHPKVAALVYIAAYAPDEAVVAVVLTVFHDEPDLRWTVTG